MILHNGHYFSEYYKKKLFSVFEIIFSHIFKKNLKSDFPFIQYR